MISRERSLQHKLTPLENVDGPPNTGQQSADGKDFGAKRENL